MTRTLFSAAAVALLALGGCASLSESQCLASDWETIGYRDGLAGTQSSALLRHQDACVKHSVVPDRERYLAGWREGVAQYCQPANGFAAGQRGAAYGNVCPPHLQEAFHAAYLDGRQLYLAQSELASLERAIGARTERLREVKGELAATTAALLSDDATATARAELLLRAQQLAEEQGTLEREIDELEMERAVQADRLEQLRHTLAFAS
jgi:ribosome modulation factor